MAIISVNNVQVGKKIGHLSVNKDSKSKVSSIDNRSQGLPLKSYGLNSSGNISFKGATSIVPVSTSMRAEKQFSNIFKAGIEILTSDDVLLLGSDVAKSVEYFKKSILKFPKIIKRVIVLEDERLEKWASAFTLNDEGLLQISNIGERNIAVTDNFNPPFSVSSAEPKVLSPAMDIFTPTGRLRVPGLGEDSQSYATMKMLKIFNIDSSHNSIAELNRKNLDSIVTVKKSNEITKLTFDSIGGHAEAKKILLQKFVYPMKFPSVFTKGKVNGALLVGPSGTGKTVLANALANEMGMNFIKVNCPDVKTMYVGEPTQKIREIFDEAISKQPCLIFFDEIDSIAASRSSSSGKTHLNVADQIMTKINEINENGYNIKVISATNNIEIIDEALIRSGRLGQHIFIGPPSAAEETKAILELKQKDILENLKISDNFNQDKFVKKLFDQKMTGATIEEVVTDARDSAFERAKVFEKMSSGQFSSSDIANIVVDEQDFDVAYARVSSKGKKKEVKQIGFKAPQYSSES